MLQRCQHLFFFFFFTVNQEPFIVKLHDRMSKLDLLVAQMAAPDHDCQMKRCPFLFFPSPPSSFSSKYVGACNNRMCVFSCCGRRVMRVVKHHLTCGGLPLMLMCVFFVGMSLPTARHPTTIPYSTPT